MTQSIQHEGPIELHLETTSTCNARCHFCIYEKSDRAGGFMSMGLFRKIVGEAAAIPRIGHVKLVGLGEPLLDRFLEERIGYLKERGKSICVFTNGVYLTPTRTDSLMAAGLDVAVISLNANNTDQHERLMGLEGEFDGVVANMDYAIAAGLRIEAHAVHNPGFGDQDALDFLARWGRLEYGGHGLVLREGNWSGSSFRLSRAWRSNDCCVRATNHINVTFDGQVTTCCADPVGKNVFGDLTTQTLGEVYHAKRYAAFREDHLANRADKYETCAGCAGFDDRPWLAKGTLDVRPNLPIPEAERG